MGLDGHIESLVGLHGYIQCMAVHKFLKIPLHAVMCNFIVIWEWRDT
jgi:hypothetical protein